ncbi:ester cyclase [Dyadobacter sp. OTU695]|uniref:ester cyclase n=1 Tax=Dyadobacter sp. OTU695 TaxID=3043860 RepID=UPI00313EE6A1
MRDITSTVLYQWFEQVWNQNSEDAIGRLMTQTADFQGIETEGNLKGAPGFKLFFRAFKAQFDPVRITVEDVVSQDDMEAARTVITATHVATNKIVVVPGICMIKVDNGKIAQAWNSYDFLSMHEQLGKKLVDADSN